MSEKSPPKHIAIIMDGNVRWSKKNKVDKINGKYKKTEKFTAVLFNFRNK